MTSQNRRTFVNRPDDNHIDVRVSDASGGIDFVISWRDEAPDPYVSVFKFAWSAFDTCADVFGWLGKNPRASREEVAEALVVLGYEADTAPDTAPSLDIYPSSGLSRAPFTVREAMREAGVPDWEMGKGVSSADAIRYLAKQRDEALSELSSLRGRLSAGPRVVKAKVEAHHPVEPGTNRRHTWTEFREAGMLWVANRILHLFGWTIVLVVDDETDELRSRRWPWPSTR